MNRNAAWALGVSLLVPALASAQGQGGPPRQTEGDAYTRYELLAPGSAKFLIIYEVTATTPGATYFYNPIRKGSVATDESVVDRSTEDEVALRNNRAAFEPLIALKVASLEATRSAPVSGASVEASIASLFPAWPRLSAVRGFQPLARSLRTAELLHASAAGGADPP